MSHTLYPQHITVFHPLIYRLLCCFYKYGRLHGNDLFHRLVKIKAVKTISGRFRTN